MKIITKQTTPTFQVGDRVQFLTFNNERGMSMYSGTEYGIIEKMNKVTAIVKTKNDIYQLNITEMIAYEDPFNGWS
jgi:hypothetical protein